MQLPGLPRLAAKYFASFPTTKTTLINLPDLVVLGVGYIQVRAICCNTGRAVKSSGTRGAIR